MTAASNGSTSADLTPLAGLFPMDAATPITGVHLGIEYRGEVVRAARWSSHLGQAPGDDSHFKIVLLRGRPRPGFLEMLDRKTAVCVPASRSGRQAHRIIGEITAAKQAAYLTRHDVDAAAINSALRERQDNLESQLTDEESARFSKGAIFVADGPGPDPSDIYGSGGPEQWMENLASWLLARCYPKLPVATDRLSDPIGEDDIGGLFASIFSQPGGGPDPLNRLGPALGLSPSGSRGPYDPSDCPVFPLIREKIGGGPASFDEVHRYLAYDVGLTGQLASLFLLLFIHHQRPEYAIQLTDEAAIFMADGGPLLGTRLTSDLIPLLAWDGGLASNGASIGPASEPRFNDARHHLSVVCPEIVNNSEDTAAEVLACTLVSMSEKIATSIRILESLEAGHDATDETGKLKAALDRLSRICGANYTDVYHSVRAVYPSLLDLRDDLETLRQLALLDSDSAEIFEARRYIADSLVPSSAFPNLAVDRETLLTGLSPYRLTGSRGRGWSVIARDAAAFKIRYTQAYREHHRQFHDALPGFQSALFTAKKKSAALGLLNTVVELGAPVGTGLEKELAAIPVGPDPCSQQGSGLDLSNEPYCSECQISLAQTVPLAELARLAPQVDMALGGKTQELSRRLVEKALAGRTDERWLEFLQIVQASELSSLANTLDNDLVAFIRQVLN